MEFLVDPVKEFAAKDEFKICHTGLPCHFRKLLFSYFTIFLRKGHVNCFPGQVLAHHSPPKEKEPGGSFPFWKTYSVLKRFIQQFNAIRSYIAIHSIKHPLSDTSVITEFIKYIR